MRIIEPAQFRKPLKKKRPLRWLVVVVAAILLGSYTALTYAKPLSAIQGQAAALSATTIAAPTLQWPATGQAAFGAVGYGVLAESGAQTTAPIASVAKVVTALAVLQAKPLKTGQQGPLLTIAEEDINDYNYYVSIGGSVVPVNSGETISEYQALQALLLPSANNMADTLVRWAFGSTEAYLSAANHLVASLGLAQTVISDSSGFSPATKSTPHDLIVLGITALNNPVIADIVRQPSAIIPVAGQVDNINGLLGQQGVNGIKTGNTDEAGGCLLFSASQTFPNGQVITQVGAVMGAPTLGQAQRDALSLLRSAGGGFRVRSLMQAQTVVGHYQTSWGSSADAATTAEVSLLQWASQAVRFKVNLNEVKVSTAKGSVVGSLVIEAGNTVKTVPLALRTNLAPPSTGWRLTHFFKKT